MKTFIIIQVLIISLVATLNTNACTAFCLKSDHQLVLAKNFDWDIDLGYVFINKSGVKKSILNNPDFSWISQYGSVTFNQFGKEFPLGGMNEKGLVIEELNMGNNPFISDSTKSKINEFQLVQFILDNCRSTDEIIAQLNNLQVEIILQTLHYIVVDSSGNSLIIEFNGKSFDYYFPGKTGFPVLSNNDYPESIKYLKNFAGFGGNLPVLNRQGSNERFVSVANMLSNYKNEEAVSYSYNILNTVKQEDTQWSIVYDIINLKIFVKFHNCTQEKIIDLKSINFTDDKTVLGFDITNCSSVNENSFSIITKDENTKLVGQVFDMLLEVIDLTDKKEIFDSIKTFGFPYDE